MLSELGWVDENMTSNNEVFMGDMFGLPENVTAALTGDDYAECVEMITTKSSSFGK